MNSTLSRVPLLLLLLPFIGGILLSHYELPSSIAYSCLCCAAIAQLYLFFLRRKTKVLSYLPLYQCSIALSCVFLGWANAGQTKPQRLVSESGKPEMVYATISHIDDNDFSMSLELDAIAVSDSSGHISHTTAHHPVIAHIEGNDYALGEGDVIVFPFKLESIRNMGNPEGFDYARYMYNRGFIYSVQLHKTEYRKLDGVALRSIFVTARHIQRKLINTLNSSRLSTPVKDFLVTAILGDSFFIDNDIRETFANAGISHILALSGLHIGIIFFILSILLLPLDCFGQKNVRLLLSIFGVIIYTFVTGLSFSAIRATIMVTFVILSRLLYRKNESYNALFGAALLILLCYPLSLFDVGFQLSFFTVLCILFLSLTPSTVPPKHKIQSYISSLVSVSLAAMIGSLALTAYYFNSISLISFITNLFILPFLPLVFGLSFFYLALLCLGIDPSIFARLIESSYQYILYVGNTIAEIPYTHSNAIYLSSTALLLCLMSVAALCLFLRQKRFLWLCCLFITTASTICLIVAERRSIPTQGFIILNEYGQTPVMIYENRNAYIWCVDDSIDVSAFQKRHRRLLNKLMIDSIRLTSDYASGYCFITGNTGVIGNKKIAFVNDNHCKRTTLNPKIQVDYLIITKKFSASVSDILRSYNPQCLILSGSIYHETLPLLIQQCHESHVNHHIMKYDGAISQ